MFNSNLEITSSVVKIAYKVEVLRILKARKSFITNLQYLKY